MALILVIEDNELNRDLLVRRLERRGHSVHWAADGEQGVRLVHEVHPDVVLMDMSLPRLDGYAATRQLRSDPATADLPVIALTAHAMTGDRERCLAAGCTDYDTKPVDLNRLLVKINALLRSPL